MVDSLVGDVLDSLDDLGYQGLFDETTILAAVQDGPSSSGFTKLISSLASELRLFYEIEEVVNPISSPSEKENFLFEISGFLTEYGCSYKSLVSGNVTKRLNNKIDCLKLILFLTSELQAAKVFFKKNPDQAAATSQAYEVNYGPVCLIQAWQADKISTLIFDQMKRLCIALRMSKPPDSISLEKFFTGIQNKHASGKSFYDVPPSQGRGRVTTTTFSIRAWNSNEIYRLNEAVKSAPDGCLSQPVVKCQLGPVHWEKLEAINDALIAEYSTRRSMLLKRVDVTISSFNWSDKAKANINTIADVYQKQRHNMTSESRITLANLLAARDDLSQVYKTSSGATRHSCAINKVLMGGVPDRGGRTDEVAPPPPEMPSWQKRQDGGGRGGGRGNFRGGGRGQFGQDNRRSANDHGRGGHRGGGNRPQSGRGGSRWGRGGGGHQNGAFDQAYGYGGQGYGRGGFASGRNTYSS